MVGVIEVDLVELGVRFPRGEVGMVIAQPHLDHTTTEPFTILPEQAQRALDCIDDTLAVALACSHGADKTHFTIFPECSLPGLAAVDRITNAIGNANWPTETVVIGGIDGLTREQYSELIQRPNVVHDRIENGPEQIPVDHWVNCSATWIKLPTGEVRCWIQPKLEPSWGELNFQHHSMHKGRSIFLFKGKFANSPSQCRFSTLLCFDWIGSKDGQRIWQWLLQGIENIAAGQGGGALSLTWLFVLQCNPQPSHISFMEQVAQFYDPNSYHSVNREHARLVMANVAGNMVPGKALQYGRSAVITTANRLMKPDCVATYCNGGEPHRAGNPLGNFRDSLFREHGACIHSFQAINPEALPHGVVGRRMAVESAAVHPLHEAQDPRTPAAAVPAVVKWVNDDLDDATKSLQHKYPAVALAAAVGAAHQGSVVALRKLAASALNEAVLIASTSTKDKRPDYWSDDESKAISHILHTFSILQAAQYPPLFHGNGAQATITNEDRSLEVIAVLGATHEVCDQHALAKRNQSRGTLLVVSRDEDNTPWNIRQQSILDLVNDNHTEYNFTDPRSAVIRVGYADVLSAFRNAANSAILKGEIDNAIS